MRNSAEGCVSVRVWVVWVVVTFPAWQVKLKYYNIAVASLTHFSISFKSSNHDWFIKRSWKANPKLIFELATHQKIIVAGKMLTNLRLPCQLKYRIIFWRNSMGTLTTIFWLAQNMSGILKLWKTEIKVRRQIRLGILVCENCESVTNMICKSSHDFRRRSGLAVMTWAVTFRKEPRQLWWINIQNIGRFSPRSNLKEPQWLWNPEENTKTQKKCSLNVPSRVFERLLLTLHFFSYK